MWQISCFTNSLEMPILLDPVSLRFIAAVSLISYAVMLFSKTYMKIEVHYSRFHFLVVTFILSILLLILSPNVFSLLLG